LTTKHLLLPLVLATLTSCSWVGGSVPRAFSPTDDCTATMRHAFAEAKFDVQKAESKPGIVGVTEVTVEATREDVPPSNLVNTDVAAYCRYDHNVLVEFRWTKPPLN
jgi:hypothetical protein